MQYKISVNIDNDTIKMIKELQNHEFLKKWKPTISDIVRVSIANFWEDMLYPEESNKMDN